MTEHPAPSATLAAAFEGAALRDVLAERRKQIETHGHDPDEDASFPPDRLPQLACSFGNIARERAERGPKQTLEGARKKAVQACALWLAAIEVIDSHIATRAIEAEHRAATADDEPDLL
jgi:hypothetical protein